MTAAIVLSVGPAGVRGEESSRKDENGARPSDVLAPAEWQAVDRSVDRALAWLARRQQPDGSFPTADVGQPGVTSLCLLAFLAKGHVAGPGKYGGPIESGIGYVLGCQKKDAVLALTPPYQLLPIFQR